MTNRAACIRLTARPCRPGTTQSTWPASIPGQPPCATEENGRLEAGPPARQMVAGGKHGESWQHYDPLVLDMYKKLGGASVMLRYFARMHEGVKLYRHHLLHLHLGCWTIGRSETPSRSLDRR
jgi:hypothetical protein